MENLITWLRGVLDEDETAAKAARRLTWESDGRITVAGDVAGVWVLGDDGDPVAIAQHATAEDGEGIDPRVIATHIALHDPHQVLADVTAKRAILELHDQSGIRWVGFPRADRQESYCVHDQQAAPCHTVRLLASAYRHRPGWNPSWDR